MRDDAGYQFAYEFDLADRLRKSLRVIGMPVGDMAHSLGVSRNTVSNWINGRGAPSARQLQLWAAYAHAPYQWLKDGEAPPMIGRAPLSFLQAG